MNMSLMKHYCLIGIAIAILGQLNGCSVYMAATQPEKKNTNVLAVGTPRSMVIAELGQPSSTEVKNNKRTDYFSFVQGYSKGAKVGRAVLHGTADVLTLGLWEVLGTPTEVVFSGDKVTYEIVYDNDDKVEQVIPINVPEPKQENTTTQEQGIH